MNQLIKCIFQLWYAQGNHRHDVNNPHNRTGHCNLPHSLLLQTSLSSITPPHIGVFWNWHHGSHMRNLNICPISWQNLEESNPVIILSLQSVKDNIFSHSNNRKYQWNKFVFLCYYTNKRAIMDRGLIILLPGNWIKNEMMRQCNLIKETKILMNSKEVLTLCK